MSQITFVKDQLLGQGVNHYVILSSCGDVLEYSGDFESREKQALAYAIVQQCTALLNPGETMKRVSMAFEDVVYIATTVVENQSVFGVVIKRGL